jgi:hypothetical protein
MKIKTEFLLPAMVLFSSHCQALDWLFQPYFNANERYADNVTMQQANSVNLISSMITTLSPGVMLGYQAENNDLKTRFTWNELIYHNAPDLNFAEKLLDVNHQYQGERFKTSLLASYHEQSSINTQLVDPTLDITGQTLVPRFTRSIAPSITFFLTEKNSLQFDYSYQDVTFDKPAGLRSLQYSDYTSQQFSATLTHAYSERLSFNLVGAYSLFDSSTSFPSENSFQVFGIPVNQSVNTSYDQKSNTFFYQGGLQYAFDELTQLSLSAGMRNTDNKTKFGQTVTYDPEIPFLGIINSTGENNLSSKASGHVFSASLNRMGEWGNVSLNAGQQLNPSSSGSQQQTTTVSAQANYNITERWTTGLNANYRLSEYTSVFNAVNTVNNSTYTTISPNIRWRWTPEINFQLSYTYAQRDYTSREQTATGNNVQLQFSYQPQINRQVK